MYRLFEVAGELHVPESPRNQGTPVPRAMPFTGFHMALRTPPTIIVSELLSDVLPHGYDGDVLLLGGETGQHPEIPLTEADIEEMADLLQPRNPASQPPGVLSFRPRTEVRSQVAGPTFWVSRR
jgi:hypothetical protein